MFNVYFSFSANQILGNPNVYPRYGAIAGTWAQPNGQLDRVHFIEVSFITMNFTRVYGYNNIHLSKNQNQKRHYG